MNWTKTSTHTLRSGDWLIVKFDWGRYVLWNKEDLIGKFKSAEEAKEAIHGR
jgi:hypothetical protein